MNQYHDKMEEYKQSIVNQMFTFEVTKCCGYSTFVTLYKTKTIVDLYTNIIDHFGGYMEIKELFFYSPEGGRIRIPISGKSIAAFIREQIICNPAKMTPVYPLPNPVVYRLYLDDGHCSHSPEDNHCTNFCTLVKSGSNV